MAIIHSQYSEAGTVVIDESTCKQCGQCAAICPADVLHLRDGRVWVNEKSAFGCIACGHCMMVCPEGSVRVSGRGASPDDLLPLPSAGERADADALSALMQSRRSVRRFSEREVDAEVLQQIVDMAASAPMGIPPWDVGCVTVRGREKVQELAADVIRGYEGFLKIFRPWVLECMRPFVKRSAYDAFKSFIRPLALTYTEHFRKGEDVLFYDAPALLFFHYSPYCESNDAVIACTYAMLAAESLGLGNTTIGGAAPILQRDKELCKKWGVPEGNTPGIFLIVGYPATHFRKSIRRRFSHVRHLE